MNTGTPPTIKSPCAAWANALAAGPGDLSAAERAALDTHVATCEACAAARADYARMDALILGLPTPAALASLPADVLTLQHEEEAGAVAYEMDGAEVLTAHSRALPLRSQRRLRSRPAAFGAIAAVLIVGVVVVGFAALLSHRQYGSGATTGFNGDFGPPVLPTGPQPQVGHWRPISLPNGVPDQLSSRFEMTPQTSVPDLLYGCFQQRDDAQAPGPLRLWRSEDEGRTWKGLSTPAGLQNGCYLDVFPGAPDTVFVTGSAVSKGDTTYYSLDRGEHWQPLQRPAGSEAWEVTAPTAEGDVWYYIRTAGVAQPEIWVSRNHGALWTSHAYPVRFPQVWVAQWSSSAYGSNLWLRYEKGGLLFLFERTLWWSPDYGATWQKLGVWSQPPCRGAIFGTPDLSVLYCIEWSGEEATDPYWRSLDFGQTWTAIPPRPVAQAAQTDAASEGGITRASFPVVLRDGSLLKIAAIPGATNDSAFYSLAPKANVWTRASAPLNAILGQCPQPTPGANLSSPFTCSAQATRLANGPDGAQYVFQERATDGKIMVGEITWAPRTP
ncbi:MAG TPA: hypothetical protein VH349_03890 [Ktedonobacterales bacterium]|jgi:hypothetical protein